MHFPLSQPPQPDAAAASDAASLAYLARRGVAPQWRGFLRGLIETLDGHLDPSARNSLLRAVGAHLGTQLPLPACNSLGDLELRMNEALATIEWGFVKLAVSHDGSIRLAHRLAPLVTTLGDAGGNWLVAALEGLYGTWLSSQPGADRLLQPRHAGGEASGTVVLRYGAE